MKQLTYTFLFGFLFLMAQGVSAQVVVDEVNINEKEDLHYVQLLAISKFMSNKVNIAVDYGQLSGWGRETRVLDGNGKPVTFNSVIDALNFMYKNGWKYIDAYVLTTGNQNVYHYTLERREGAN